MILCFSKLFLFYKIKYLNHIALPECAQDPTVLAPTFQSQFYTLIESDPCFFIIKHRKQQINGIRQMARN